VARSGLGTRVARERRPRIAELSFAAAVAAVALGGAAYLASLHLHTRTYHYNCAVVFPHGVTCGPNQRATWQLPVAVVIALLGAGMALGVTRRSRRIVVFSLAAGAAGIATVFAVLGLVDAWHKWAALSNSYVYLVRPPDQMRPAPAYTCLPIIGRGYASPSTYLWVGLGCALAGACSFLLARRIKRVLAALDGRFVWPLPRSRIAIAGLVLGATFTASPSRYSYSARRSPQPPSSTAIKSHLRKTPRGSLTGPTGSTRLPWASPCSDSPEPWPS
jgi:hypothetical protein